MDFFRGVRPLLFSYVLINGILITLQTKEEMLLDMRATGGELGWLTWPLDQGDKSGWEVVQRTLNGSQFYTYSVCNVGEREQDNWLRTTFIQRRPSASRVFVELQFIVRDCNSFGGASMTCKETFNLFTSESDADVGTAFRKGQFKKVTTIAPDEITGKNELRINTETRVVENLSRKGFYLAFQDIGACVALLSVKVYYKTCPATVKSLASFPETVAGGENQVLREVSGLCVDNAISEEVPRIYCTVDGEWVVPVGQCQCKPGHEEVEDACKECEPGFFKAAASGDECEPCPSNTQRLGSGALSCPCMDGFYRAPTDPPTGPCSGPPSAPQDLMATTTQLSAGKLLISWNPPEDKGGRTDITYSIECQRCEGTVCLPCGEKIRYDPASTGLTGTKVSVSELDAHLNYTFTVEAHNGVSLLAGQATAGAKRPPSVSTLTTSLHNTDPPKITSIRLVEKFDTSLSLSWDVSPRPRILHRPLRYELTYRKKDDNLDVTTYTVLILEKNSVQISDLSPGTAYLFRVQALSSDGSPGGSTMEEQFETSSEGPLNQNNTAVIFGAAVGGAAMLFIVVVVLLVRRRKRNSHTRQGPEDTYFSSAEQLKPLKTYVDPHTYEDPNTAILKFATEIHPSHITKQKVIGAGEFGEVYRGILKVPGRKEVAVAIKTLKPGYTEKQRQDFLSEASIMGQFSHQNIIRLEGVVTKCKDFFKHAMIVTEYMENGALDRYLKDHDGEFSSFQLVGMLRGIAAGMKYLSDMSYVHRDWRPTSTLDWCEENYVASFYIAEFWNTVSNLIMILPPIYGAIQTFRDGLEFRYICSFIGLAAVGVGSWCFHMTLLYEMQLLDELPMIYSTCVFVYCLYECFKQENSLSLFPIALLLIFSVSVTVVYLQWKEPVFHQVMYGALVACLVMRSIFIVTWVYPWLRPLCYTSLGIFLFGFLLWNIDNIFCDSLRASRQSLPPGVGVVTQFHAWWHIFTGLGSYLHILLSLQIRSTYLKYRPKVKFLCGVWPALHIEPQKTS